MIKKLLLGCIFKIIEIILYSILYLLNFIGNGKFGSKNIV